MDKDPLEDLVNKASREFNAPPEPPREAMWAAIQRERQARKRPKLGLIFGTPRVWIPAAAAAVLVVGFLLGRASAPGTDPAVPGTNGPVTAETIPETTPAPIPSDPAPTTGSWTDAAVEATYQLAAVKYLNRTETFLTQVQNASANPGADEEVSAWARSLLTETRLLLDSPVSNDRDMNRLLDDLEVLLAQIVLLADVRVAAGRESINETMNRSAILLRVRNKIPVSAGI